MKDLLREVKELEAAIAFHSDAETEHSEQIADWLTELLEIKNARLSAEVFMDNQSMQTEMPDVDDMIDGCGTCGWTGGLQEERGELKCPNCGRKE